MHSHLSSQGGGFGDDWTLSMGNFRVCFYEIESKYGVWESHGFSASVFAMAADAIPFLQIITKDIGFAQLPTRIQFLSTCLESISAMAAETIPFLVVYVLCLGCPRDFLCLIQYKSKSEPEVAAIVIAEQLVLLTCLETSSVRIVNLVHLSKSELLIRYIYSP